MIENLEIFVLFSQEDLEPGTLYSTMLQVSSDQFQNTVYDDDHDDANHRVSRDEVDDSLQLLVLLVLLLT